jgi:hypothetical protein
MALQPLHADESARLRIIPQSTLQVFVNQRSIRQLPMISLR